jgi:hypothetical protein
MLLYELISEITSFRNTYGGVFLVRKRKMRTVLKAECIKKHMAGNLNLDIERSISKHCKLRKNILDLIILRLLYIIMKKMTFWE